MRFSQATVVVSTTGVAGGLEVGGYFWVYMQYVQGLRELGCDVYWLDRHSGTARDSSFLAFFDEMKQHNLGGRCTVYAGRENGNGRRGSYEYAGMPAHEIEAVFERADLLLNFYHGIDPALLSRFRRSAFVDLDPGLLQIWIDTGGLRLAPHDRYFTIGETVGTPSARFPGCGLEWIHVRPAVSLTLWPFTYTPESDAFTTVSSWWGQEWVLYGGDAYDNTKRASFLRFLALPRSANQALELALALTGDVPSDTEDRTLLQRHGWRVCRSFEVAGSPALYRRYIQKSRGEFSCAKPSCMRLQAAWVSDRTVCYLASGKPVVVQNTGPSTYLPNGRGLFRFSTISEAADALRTVNADYDRHCRAAREIAEAYFSATGVCERILDHALE
jgi:hypothetical protein